jgi:hypothetical protein
MEEAVKAALEFSKFNHSLSLKRKTLKDKMSAKLTLGHSGGLFKIDRSLISFVQMLVDQGRTSNVPLLDDNDNPVVIADLEDFRDEILDRYFSVTLEYHEEFEKIKKARSVEKLLDI